MAIKHKPKQKLVSEREADLHFAAADTANWLMGMLTALDRLARVVRQMVACHSLEAAEKLRDFECCINAVNNVIAKAAGQPPTSDGH